MSAIYNEYLTGVEREEAIAEAALENEFNKLQTMFEMTTLKLEQMKRDAELKVFSESGTYDDLVFLMQEAEQEVAQERKGILTRIFEGIQKMIGWILGKLGKNKGQGNPDDTIDVDEGAVQTHDIIKDTWGKINGGVNKIKNGDIIGGLKEVSGIILGVSAITGGAIVTGKMIKKKRSEVEGMENEMNPILTSIKDVLNKITGFFGSNNDTNKQEEANKNAGGLQKFVNAIKKVIEAFSNALGNVKDKAAEVAGNIKDAVTGNKSKEYNKQAKANKKEQDTANKNGLLIKAYGGVKYSIDRRSGSIAKEENGSWVSIDDNAAPEPIKKAALKAKGATAMQDKANAKQAENNTAINSNYKPTIVKRNPDTNVTVRIDGKTGNINVNNNGNVTRLNNIKEVDKYFVGHKYRNIRKELKTAYQSIMNGISDANKTKDAIQTNESVFDTEEVINVLTESTLVYNIDNDELCIDIDSSLTEAEIVEELNNSGYYVETTKDRFIISECETISPSMSIFGYELSNESVMEEADFFENELDELADIFKEL